ncbi:MAG: pentapeptide repeat-containing protein, partial [Cyanobacteria bacterium P01_E01_bin.43]
TLANTTLVHADLTRTNLRGLRCVGSDLSGATLTGAQMHGAIAYDIQTTEIICEWVDLSPLGDQSQRRYFNTEADLHTFLNQRPPQVTVIVDQVMTLAAQAAIATIFERLGQVSDVLSRPPNVELTHRHTQFTFVVEDILTLTAIAYLVTWPFQDGQALQKTLQPLMEPDAAPTPQSVMQAEATREIQRVTTALQKPDLMSLRELIGSQPFFTTPLQVKLANAYGRTLTLYHNPQFGVRRLPVTNNSRLPVPIEFVQSPILADYLAFLTPP